MEKYWLVAIPAVVVAALLYRVTRYGGFTAAIFGARIARTLGEVEPYGGIARRRVKVHLLESDNPDQAVGLEVVTTGLGSYRVSPIKLSRGQALELSRLLSEAAGARPAG